MIEGVVIFEVFLMEFRGKYFGEDVFVGMQVLEWFAVVEGQKGGRGWSVVEKEGEWREMCVVRGLV